jgi:regulator of nucleoside diphosphate kinase
MSRTLPEIVIRAADEDRLAALANRLLESRPELGEELLAELARAQLASDDALPPNTVQMGSTVTYEADGRSRQVTLVYPAEANIDAGCISVATPIGTALLGLGEGQAIEWTARDGRRQELTILSVSQGAATAA